MPDDHSGNERERLAAVYAAMVDGELQRLAHEFASLSPEAQQALEDEFRHRNLIPDVDLLAQTQSEDRVEWDDLVMIRKFRDLPEALLAKGSLESAGIDAVLVDDNMVRMDWFISNLLGGIKLCVQSADEEAALAALEQPTPATIEVEGLGTYEQPSCPRCHSLDVTFEALNRTVAYGSAWLGFPIPLRRKRWKCNACGLVWEPESELSEPHEQVD
jgi:hypothetical protein